MQTFDSFSQTCLVCIINFLTGIIDLFAQYKLSCIQRHVIFYMWDNHCFDLVVLKRNFKKISCSRKYLAFLSLSFGRDLVSLAPLESPFVIVLQVVATCIGDPHQEGAIVNDT